jgi:ribosome biogenesis protein Nip4
MSAGISLILIKDGERLDITSLVESVQWKGRKGAAARSISAVLLDDSGYKHARAEIDVAQGRQCIFSYDGQELFRGMIMSQKQSDSKKMSITAYDNGIYLANNKDTFCYENKTATEIFKDCMARYGIPITEAAQTSHRIPELTKPNTTAFDVVCDALSLDFEATGVRHYVQSEKGALKLLTRRENILQWVIETGANLISYAYDKSIEKTKTRVKMISKEGTVVATGVKQGLEEKIGIFQDIEKSEENLSYAQLQEIFTTMLNERSEPQKSLDIDALGVPDVISGVGVFVIIKDLGLSRTFYVDEDAHTFTGRAHNMKLKLTFANDLSKEAPEAAEAGVDCNIGDIVNFLGGFHYISSNAAYPVGSKRAAGPAKLTLFAKGEKHPYHLIHVGAESNVYGWVDAGTFAK